ncbi:MAG: hypothetical protein ACTTIM_05675 [Campylobacter sp.]
MTKKFLFIIALAMSFGNVAFADNSVKVGENCKDGKICPPNNDGTLYGEATLGVPATKFEYTCEYWGEWEVKKYDTIFKRGYHDALKKAIKEGKLDGKDGRPLYDLKTDKFLCGKETKISTQLPFDKNGKIDNSIARCNNKYTFEINGYKFTNDCNEKKIDRDKIKITNHYADGTMLRQTNLEYNDKVGAFYKMEKRKKKILNNSSVESALDVMGGREYINGDYASTAKSVMKYHKNILLNKTTYDNMDTTFIKEDSMTSNSSKQKISLPPKLNSKDIVFARLYWSGTLHTGQNSKNELKHKEISNNDQAKNFIKNLIKGYRDVELLVENHQQQKVEAKDDKDVFFDYSIDFQQGGMYMMYSASADVTKYIQDAIEKNQNKFNSNLDKPVDLEVSVGNLKATDGKVRWHFTAAENTGILTYNHYIANYGNWSILIVYDKRDLAGIDKNIYEKYYKPKSLTLYDGFSELMAPTDLKTFATFTMDGFFTPVSDDYDASNIFYQSKRWL